MRGRRLRERIMKARDAFGVIVRAAGFGFVLAGVIDLAHLAIEALGLPVRTSVPADRILTAAGVWIILGLAVLAGASGIVALIYGRAKPD